MQPEVVTGFDEFASAAADASSGARVPIEVRVTVDDPFLAYRRAREGTGGAYLATTGGQSGWGYFGVDPIDTLEVDPGDGDALPALSSWLDTEQLHRGGCDVPFPCGAIGWLSYDVVRDLEQLPENARRDRELPRIQVTSYETLAAWEEPRGERVTLRITSCPRVDATDNGAVDDAAEASDGTETTDDAIRGAYDCGRETALALAHRAVDGNPGIAEQAGTTADGTATASFESDCSREAFTDRVRTVKQYVRDGDTFQANISQRLCAPAAVHPVAAFDALRDVNPAPYSGLLEFPGVDLVSASPELLLEREGDRLVTEPIAGTRPRGATEEEDDRLERDLVTDEKERAEHAMLVDLERNDLGKVCAFGTVDVTEYRRVDRYSEVMHLVSKVEGRIRPEHDLDDAIAAVFPGGTITGAPKPRTMEIIDEVEATRRGPYTGSIGIFGFDDRAILNIIIRTLVRYDDEYHLRVGAGIVHDSVPEREYAETLDKARALVTAVDQALGDRVDLRMQKPSGD
jgi:anthranilate synthase component 1